MKTLNISNRHKRLAHAKPNGMSSYKITTLNLFTFLAKAIQLLTFLVEEKTLKGE